MHGDTANGVGKGSGKDLQEVPVGGLFYLRHGNKRLPLAGKFISVPSHCGKGDGWLQRPKRAEGLDSQLSLHLQPVPADELPEFDATLLKLSSAAIWPNWRLR